MAPKPKRLRRGSGSASQPAEVAREHEAVSLDFATRAERERYDRLRTRPYFPDWYIDPDVLTQLGIFDDVMSLIRGAGWARFFDIREPGFEDMTLEFLTTFVYRRECTGSDHPLTVSFRLFGRPYHMSLHQFGVALGFYSESDTVPDPTDFESSIHGATFWATITTGPAWQSTKSKSSQLTSPVHRYLHRLIAHTIGGRRESDGHVTARDLFHLWSLVTGTPICITHSFAVYVEHTVIHSKGAICVLPYITRLARGLGFFREGTSMEVTVEMRPLSFATLHRMHLVRKVGPHRFALVGVGEDEEDIPHPHVHHRPPPSSSIPSTSMPPPSTYISREEYERDRVRDQRYMEWIAVSLRSYFDSIGFVPPPFPTFDAPAPPATSPQPPIPPTAPMDEDEETQSDEGRG